MNNHRKISRLLTLIVALAIPGMASAGPINVVIDTAGLIGPKAAAKGKPYLVYREGVSAAGLNDKKIDIEASKKFCADKVARGEVREGYCEPNYIYSVSVSPNDPRAVQQYANQNAALLSAWGVATGSKSVQIAIIDTGVQYTHPDLAANMWSNPNEVVDGLDNDNNGFVDDTIGYDFVQSDNDPNDSNEHGTHCSGSAGAVGNNGEGVAGASWSASIMAVRVLDAQGAGFLSDVASGVRYAVDNGAHVLSLSLGGSSSSQVLENALSYACSKGALVAVAAGNESANNDVTPSFPANYNLPCLISVAATDSSDQLADFSNFGASTVHIAAPGVEILSTVPGSSYGFLSGTSMATPLVAGIGALVKSVKPELSGVDIKNVLLQSVDNLPQLNGKVTSGGRVNAANAIAIATGTTPTAPPAPPAPPGASPGEGTDPGEDEFTEDIEIEAAVVQSSRVTVTGYLYLIEDESAVEGQRVEATCTNRKGQVIVLSARSSSTDEDGFFSLRFSRKVAAKLRGGGFCFLSSENSDEKKVRLKVRR
jgi:subtilisin family serine protease